MRLSRSILLASSILCAAGIVPGAALAQDSAAAEAQPAAGGLTEIVVTARKREETVQDVPVAVTAFSEQLILDRDITSVEKIAAIAPNFSVGRASNGSGAQLTMRGIGSSSTSIGIEQSVAVVVDGAYYGQGRVINEGFFDLQRVEVLKGPQALFFGKNATAGVLSFTTNDPGPEAEFILRAGYEFNAEQYRVEGIASVPLGESAGIRLALRYSKMEGGLYDNIQINRPYTTFDVVDLGAGGDGDPIVSTATPVTSDQPGEEEFLGRVTLKVEPSDRLTINLKGSYNFNSTANSSWNYVPFACGQANGLSQLTGLPCAADFITRQNNLPTDIAASFPLARADGRPFNRYESVAINGAVDWEGDNFVISSITNYQWNNNQFMCVCDFQTGNNTGTWATEDTTWEAFSQELRLRTTLDGPFNVMIGALYQDTRRDFNQFIMFAGLRNSAAAPENVFLATTKDSFTDGKTLSLFGQVTFAITPELELAAGGRYTDESKDSFFTQPYNNPALTFIFRDQLAADGLGEVVAAQDFEDFAPEVTLSYKPSADLLVFAAYKTGYKSGGFSNGGINSAFSADPFGDLTFAPETVEGFELGVKSTLADNQLRLNLTLFTYDYSDLQVDFFNSPIFAFQTLTADARTRGVEVDFEYAPFALAGLNLRGSINYTDAQYTDFPGAPCYAGQTISEGCTLIGGISARQDLTGARLSVAPEWTGTLGAAYTAPLGDSFELGLNVDARYSDSYIASGFGNPLSLQDSYVTLDAGVRFGAVDGNWQLAVIGKNLTNEFFITGVVDGPSTGSGTGTAVGTRADQLGFGNLPRTVMVEFTKRF
jgi:outer membrane receptor protein involved in Fe transport